nr:hypothetical protein [Tanacetum cinerariifolium]
LRVFGCKASVHIPKDERSKLDVKNKPVLQKSRVASRAVDHPVASCNRRLQGRLGRFLQHWNKPCVFLGYGQDELRYRLYDPVQKRLVRSRDVEFEEYQTLKDVEKAEKEIIPQHNDDPIDLDPVPPKHFDSRFEDDIQNDEEHEQPNLDKDVHPELPVPMPPFVPLRRSTIDRHPSTRYSANEYVLLTDGGEPECYVE